MGTVTTLCSVQEYRTRQSLEESLSADYEKRLDAVTFLKNAVIGSNKQKQSVIDMGFVVRLLQILEDKNNLNDTELALEATAAITSLAKGTDEHVREILATGCLPVLFSVIANENSGDKLLQIALRALRSLYSSDQAPVGSIYESQERPANWVASRMLQLAGSDQLFSNQECVATILAKSCQFPDNQRLLREHGAVSVIGNLITSPCYKVQLAALDWLAQICYQNEQISTDVVTPISGRQTIPETLTQMMSQEKPTSMQLHAAKCMTYLYRAGAICPEDKRIVYKTLPTLIRICKKEKEPLARIEAAEILAYLTELDTLLQQTASICDHIIPTLANMLKCQTDTSLSISAFNGQSYHSLGYTSPVAAKKLETDVKIALEMKQAAFKAFASLGANDEEIRKKIIETDMLMDHIIAGLSDVSNAKIRLAALRCLHSLSRSVKQLKTTFQDHTVWVPLQNLLQNPSDDVLMVASSTMCNLLLEFSNSKQYFLDRKSMDLLCNLTRREEPALRLNGVWALMNMAYDAEQPIKMQILSSITTDHIYRLLSPDQDSNVVMKTLGLLRNLLGNKIHVDHIMTLHGREIMQELIKLLDDIDNRQQSSELTEQTLCIFANIAIGESARDFIMQSEDILTRLVGYMNDKDVKIQIAAVYCMSNLAWSEDDGAHDRQVRLKEFGVHRILQQLLSSIDTTLFDKAKTALQQFN